MYLKKRKEDTSRDYQNTFVKSGTKEDGDNEKSVHATHVQAEMGVMLQTAQGLVSDIQENNSSYVIILFWCGQHVFV